MNLGTISIWAKRALLLNSSSSSLQKSLNMQFSCIRLPPCAPMLYYPCYYRHELESHGNPDCQSCAPLIILHRYDWDNYDSCPRDPLPIRCFLIIGSSAIIEAPVERVFLGV